jgi:hypothetical protein
MKIITKIITYVLSRILILSGSIYLIYDFIGIDKEKERILFNMNLSYLAIATTFGIINIVYTYEKIMESETRDLENLRIFWMSIYGVFMLVSWIYFINCQIFECNK